MEIYKEINGIKERVYDTKTVLEKLRMNGFEVSTQLFDYYLKKILTIDKHYIKEDRRNYFLVEGVKYLIDYLEFKNKYSRSGK